MENDTVLQDTLTPESEESLDSLATPEAAQEVAVQEILEKNKKLFARAKKAEEERKTLKEKLASLDKVEVAKTQPASATEPQSRDEIEEVLDLRSQGFSDSEILSARKYAKKMNAAISEVLNDEYFKAGVEARRSKVKSEQATPSPSNRTTTVQVNGKSWDQLSAKERNSNEAIKAFWANRR